MMSEKESSQKTQSEKQAPEIKLAKGDGPYYFPRHSITIYAKSKREAEQKLKEYLKEQE